MPFEPFKESGCLFFPNKYYINIKVNLLLIESNEDQSYDSLANSVKILQKGLNRLSANVYLVYFSLF